MKPPARYQMLWIVFWVMMSAVAVPGAAGKDSFLSVPRAGTVRSQGPADAPVRVVEYGDLSCPTCFSAHRAAMEIVKKYPGQILYEFRLSPNLGHTDFLMADTALDCALDQQKFWEYHDRLLEDHAVWAANPHFDRFVQYARELGLDVKRFTACLQDPRRVQKVKEEAQRWQDAGLVFSPAFYVQGRLFTGEQFREQGEAFIRQLLRNRKPD